MIRRAKIVVAVLGFGCAFGAQSAPSQQRVGIPNFSPSIEVGWIPYGGQFLPPSNGPGPVMNDPAHPWISNQVAFATGQQPTFHVSDPDNLILQPWARDALRTRNERVLSGKPGYTRQAGCWPMGVPGFLLRPAEPTYFIQTAKEVVMVSQEDLETRRIYLNVPHSAEVKPSWHGESIGHYEGDTLVVDTIGLNDQTWIDNFRTPHTDQLHVVERFRLVDEGMTLQVDLHVEDPGAFTVPWSAIQRYRRVAFGPMTEAPCAENNPNYFNHDVEPIPQAAKPDF